MREGWKLYKLDDVCYFENGDRGTNYPSKAHRAITGIPFINAGHLNTNGLDIESMDYITRERFNLLGNGKIKKGDILFCLRGSLGKFAQVDEYNEGAIASSLVIIRPKDKITANFLMLYFESDICIKMISNFSNGAAQPNLSAGSLKKFEIPVPPLKEQHRIVSILDEAFAAIAKAKANAEQNLKNAREVYESYLHNVFQTPDKNWHIKEWGELCQFVRGPFGGSLKKNIFKKDGYVVYEQKHAIHDHFNELRYFIDENKFNEMKRFEVQPGDILMSCSGVTLGRVVVVPKGIRRGIINQALLKLTPKKSISVHFLKYWLRSKVFQDLIFKYSGGAAIPNVPSAKILKGVLIPVPSLKEQNKIVNDIEAMISKSQQLEAIYDQKLSNLDHLKKSILQKAFSGELNLSKEVVA
jgi:type I restriction enzyme S subunit